MGVLQVLSPRNFLLLDSRIRGKDGGMVREGRWDGAGRTCPFPLDGEGWDGGAAVSSLPREDHPSDKLRMSGIAIVLPSRTPPLVCFPTSAGMTGGSLVGREKFVGAHGFALLRVSDYLSLTLSLSKGGAVLR